MQKISDQRHRFSPHLIQHVVWLYARFTLSYRDVEDLPALRPTNSAFLMTVNTSNVGKKQ